MIDDDPETTPRLSALLEGLNFGVVIIDRDLKVLWLNAPMERLFEVKRADVQGLDAFTFVKNHILPKIVDREAFGDRMLTSIAAGTSLPAMEFHMVSPSGATYWIEYCGEVIEQGPFRGMRLEIYQDITLKVLLQKEIERHLGHLGEVIEGRNAELNRLGEQLRTEVVERIRAEQELLREREFRANLMNNAPAFFVALDREMKVRLMNEPLLKILGYGEEVTGRDFIADFIPASERDAIGRKIADSIATGSPFVSEYPILARDGSTLECEWHHRSILKPDGTLDYHLAVGIDVSERKAIEGALKRSESLYRAIFESSLAATAIVNEEGTTSRINAEFTRIYGYKEEELKGKRIFSLFPGGERERFVRLLSALRTDTKAGPRYEEFRILDAAGSSRDAILSAARIPEGGEVIVSFLDITDRKAIERDREQYSRHLYIMNQLISAAGMTESLEDGLKLLLERAIDLLGLDAGAVYLIDRERRTATLKAQRGMPEWMERTMSTVSTDRDPFRVPFSERKPLFLDRGVTGLFSAALIPFLSDHNAIGAMYAISGARECFSEHEKKILESISSEIGGLIHRSMLQRELAEMNEEANLYLDIMVHDINNANTLILMYTELLSEELAEKEKRELAIKLQASVRRSIDIIENVSTIRKIREGRSRLERYRLDSVIRRAIDGFPNANILYTGTDVEVVADELLEEVFANLIDNSLKFGGPKTEIAIHVLELDGEVEVSVEDNGPGIPDEIKNVVFRRFERGGERRRRGSGLGLYICRMLVERYGGRIWADDRIPGESARGAAIRFRLKRAS